MISRTFLLFIGITIFCIEGFSQSTPSFRNGQLDVVQTPFRLPLPVGEVTYIDIDKDGDPDVLQATLPSKIKVQWIDDDDDMKEGDREGDLDNDCVMIDVNQDGIYGGEKDLIVDWSDENGDSVADIQAIVDNGKKDFTGKWESHYIWFMDDDQDGVFGYVDWNHFKFEGWDHDGRANFFTDYNGKSKMLKVHITTWNLEDLTYNWENPFLFYDPDKDGLTEMAIRLVDEPIALPTNQETPLQTWDFSKKISLVQMTFDLDNDSEPSNELDYDMSLKFMGTGFDYSDQVHSFKNIAGPEMTNYLFEDSRWRQLEELVYPDHATAYDLTFNRGEWAECWLVFDEDDDCQRWERVEFYDPKDPFKIGTKNGGLDHNPQADPAGDRGEWDRDFSGKGQLYISPLDCRIHLLGAEKGYWRIDQNATYFQGWQGWRGENLQPEDFDKAEPTRFGTMEYMDTDNNGFMDQVRTDLDGDTVFETTISLKDLGINDKGRVYDTANMEYEDFQAMYQFMANEMWANAKNGLAVAKAHGLNTAWYSTMMHPKSWREKYNYGYWLSFYIYQDLMTHGQHKEDKLFIKKIQQAYFSSNWKRLN